MDLGKNLMTYVQAKYSLIGVESVEERRVLGAIRGVGKTLGMRVVTWSIASGFKLDSDVESEGLDILDPDTALMWIEGESDKVIGEKGALFVLLDFAPYVEKGMPVNVPIVRRMRELGARLKGAAEKAARKTLVMVAPGFNMPEGLADEVVILREKLPDAAVLGAALDALQKKLPEKARVEGEVRARVIEAGCGLTVSGFSDVLARSLVSTQRLDAGVVAEEKKQVVGRSGLVRVLEHSVTFADVGGLEVLREWARLRKLGFTERAREYGLRRPRGVLLGGPPGTGKSLSVYALAGEFELPLLRLGEIEDSLVGESQKRLRKALDVASAIAPCMLFVDEAEKLFSGGGGGGGGNGGASDGGVKANMLGMWLTWMQENEGVFVAMTSNQVDLLPAELVRKGRLDEMFLVDLPTGAERGSIWRVKIRAKGREAGGFDVEALAKESAGMTGAEIEAAFEAAMFRAFSQGVEVSQAHVVKELEELIPLATTMKEKLDVLRRWCRGKLKPASLPDEAVTGSDDEGSRLAGLL